MNQRELTVKALSQLEFHTGLVTKVTESGRAAEDAIGAQVEFNNNKKLVAELRRWSNEGDIDAMIAQLAESTDTTGKIYVSDHINQELGARLRKAKVNYIDKVGNAYLDISPIFVLIEGKIPTESSLSDKTAKLFTETGLKVIYALLTNQRLLNSNYRTIADHANVSMGTIGWVLRELRHQNFLREAYRIHTWKDKVKLINTWTEEYSKLRAKTQLGVYYSKDKDWWRDLDLEKYNAVLGGELAAANYVDDVQARTGLIYLGKHKQGDFIRDLNLVSAEQLETSTDQLVKIDVRTEFWGKLSIVNLSSKGTDPLLTYADLMDTWESKNIRIAKLIADKYIFA